MKKILIAVATLAVAGCLNGLGAQDTLRVKDSTLFYGHLNWYDLDTLHQWRSTVDDSYGRWETDAVIAAYYGNERYFVDSIYSTWFDTGYANHNPPISYVSPSDRYRFGNTIIGNQMETERPLKIVGIAACGFMQRPADTVNFFFRDYYNRVTWEYHRESGCYFPNTRDLSMAGRITDSLILYKPTSTGAPEKLASGPWRVEWPHRDILLPLEDSLLRCSWRSYPCQILNEPVHYDSTPTVALYEVYFDKPVVVEDSFIVAGTAFNNEGSYGYEYPPAYDSLVYSEWMWLWDHCPTRYWNLYRLPILGGGKTGEDTPHPFPERLFGQPRWIKYRNRGWGREMYYSNARIIFPIIEPEYEPCAPVENVRVAEVVETSATLMWDAANNVRWEVMYGIVGQPEESYRILSTTVPTVTLTGLLTGQQYRACVRGWCDSDSSYTEWSDGVSITTVQPEEVERPGTMGRFIRLLPNPAREAVSVMSSYKMNRIEVYSLNGCKVLEQEADGISTVVDVSGLASGTYIAAVYLPHGVATKKLVVE